MKKTPVVILVVSLLLPGRAWSSDAVSILEPRSYGFSVGDIIAQRVPLPPGARLEAKDLPQKGRVGLSLWRRHAAVESDGAGNLHLHLHYQLLNSPPTLDSWELPALQIRALGAKDGIVQVPAQSFTAGRLTLADAGGRPGFVAMQNDVLPPLVPVAPLDRRVMMAGGMLAAALLAWVAATAWLRTAARSRRPFARAARDVRTLPDNSPEAWRRLQHAINDAAGQVVRKANIEALVARHPYLERERPSLEKFCEDANLLFFGGRLPEQGHSVHRLAQRLKQLEARYAA